MVFFKLYRCRVFVGLIIPPPLAFQGRSTGIITPRYDQQEDIYLAEGGILDNLRSAVTAMDSYDGAIQLGGDIIYNGDLESWIRFANSLRIRYLMRISDRIDISPELTDIFSSGQFINSNEQNAVFDFTDNLPNSFEIATVRVGIFNLFVMSATSEQILTDFSDPRIEFLFRPSGNNNDFNGLINGIDAGSTTITVDDFARPGTVFRENTGDLSYNYMTTWETAFLLSEASVKGLINEDPRTWYEKGVMEAFAYWDTPLPANYLTDSPTAFDSNRGVEQNITQKWIANIGNNYENWAEWRRTGFPAMMPVAASLNDGLYPVRFPYPADEEALNFENYQQAAAATDGNSVNVRVWWDSE
ncbi:MAG: SusD/RagB family nutrient-binding outer membrane lipoprotein [Bacteroidota bacterium]